VEEKYYGKFHLLTEKGEVNFEAVKKYTESKEWADFYNTAYEDCMKHVDEDFENIEKYFADQKVKKEDCNIKLSAISGCVSFAMSTVSFSIDLR
jgi:hypothetical protein